MRSAFPISLLFFVATGFVFLLQVIPGIGIFLMLLMAPLWSVVLVNAGMIGVAAEAFKGRVSRGWLVIPIVFYGGYYTVAVWNHVTLYSLRLSYDTANARVAIPFDPDRQSLVFESGDGGAWYTQNFALPVAYSVNPNRVEGYLSTRMMEDDLCETLRDLPASRAAGIVPSWFHDDDESGRGTFEQRFCNLSIPERPTMPQVRISRHEGEETVQFLPVKRVTTTVTTPDGRRFELRGGRASPYGWIPKPVIGCALSSGNPSWDCVAGFARGSSVPIVSGNSRYARDSLVLAQALRLKPVAVAQRRRGAVPETVLAMIAEVEQAALARQLVAVDAMIADPLAEASWDTGVLANHPEALASRAGAIMSGIERAAAIKGDDRYRARESGRVLARLLAALPADRFADLGPRILAVYGEADDDHWLWQSETLLRRLGDLGVGALPFLVEPSVNGANIEGLCRLGAAGRDGGGPVLLKMWNESGEFDRRERISLYVALRRMGVTPPPLAQDKRNLSSQLQAYFRDVSPQSPASVCDTHDVVTLQQGRRHERSPPRQN